MKLLFNILFFLLAIFQTNFTEAKVVVFDTIVSEIKFSVDNLQSKNESIQILENDVDITCKSESDLVDYRNLLSSSEGTAAKTSTSFAEGSFSVFNWKGYPAGGIKPTGTFRSLEGAEYTTARNLANKTNAALHKANPQLKGVQIHEIHPVKFGGSPTDMSNKIFLTPSQHSQYTNFWNSLMRSTK